MPVAAALSPIAEQNGANARRVAEMIFLSTLLSMITVPVASVLLHML
jgi:predicted permease